MDFLAGRNFKQIFLVTFGIFIFSTFLPLRHIVNFESASRYGWFAEPLAISIYAADIIFAILLMLFLKIVRFRLRESAILLAVCLFFTAEALRNPDFSLGLYSLIRLLQLFLLIIISVKLFEVRKNCTYISVILLSIGIFQTLLGAYQVTTGHSFGLRYLGEQTVSTIMPGVAKVSLSEGERLLRAYGTMPHPNILAGFLILCIIAGLILYNEHPNRRILIGIGLGIITFGLFLTFSRSAYISFLILLIIVLWKFPLKFTKKKIGIMAIFVSLASLLVLYISPLRIGFWNRLVPAATDLFIADRIILASNGAKIISQNLFFGVGLGNYIQSLIDLFPIGNGLNYWQYDYPHNVFASVPTELGFYGLFLLIIIIYTLLKRRYFLKRNLMFILIILLPLLLLDHYFWTNQIGRVTLILFLTLSPYVFFEHSKSAGNVM